MNGALSTSRTASPPRAISRRQARSTRSGCRSRAAAPAATRRCWRSRGATSSPRATSAYGVAELVTFAETTHKFESRYLDWLLGTLPDAIEVYRDRSPLTHADNIRAAALIAQGLDDEVVPPDQAEQIVAALVRNGVPHAYLPFEGEGHGFRRRESRDPLPLGLAVVLRADLRLRAGRRRRAARDRRALAHGDRRPHAQRRRRAAAGRARGEAEARTAAAREARNRRHRSSRDARQRRPAAADARVPGRGPRRRPDRRRLHDADRRPFGPFGHETDPRPRGDRPERSALLRARLDDHRPREDGASLQQRVAVEGRLRGAAQADADDDRRAHPRARRLREALGRAHRRSPFPSSSTR